MSTAKSKQLPAPDLDASQPFVGALLRLCWTQVWRHIHQSLKADGFTDLSESHLPFFRYPGPDASRPSDLARRLQVSRQVVNHGIAQLEKLDGVVESRVRTANELTKKLSDSRRRGLQCGVLPCPRLVGWAPHNNPIISSHAEPRC